MRALLGHRGPFAVGLRLSAQAAETLEQPSELAAFREFLRAGDYYVLTINGFPYGAFHGQRVKEQVYRPDWRDDARLEYANRLARLLAVLLTDRPDIEGSVSTVPGAFRSEIAGGADEVAMATRMLRHAAELVALRQRTGVTITLAIEPEPACYIETVDDAVAFFRDFLFDPALVRQVAADSQMPLTVDDVRHHVGLCFDACHMRGGIRGRRHGARALERRRHPDLQGAGQLGASRRRQRRRRHARARPFRRGDVSAPGRRALTPAA